jgi:hypothetical protein
MKRAQLKKIIREEIKKIKLNEKRLPNKYPYSGIPDHCYAVEVSKKYIRKAMRFFKNSEFKNSADFSSVTNSFDFDIEEDANDFIDKLINNKIVPKKEISK